MLADGVDKWWLELLAERERLGTEHADAGIYDPPYSEEEDPQDTDENEAYKRGFNKRRHELGDRFKWA